MRKVLATILACSLGLAVVADTATNQPPRRRRPHGVARDSGGLVATPATGNVVRIVSAQNRVDDVVISAVARSITLDVWVPVEIEKADDGIRNARGLVSKTFAKPRTGIVVAVVDEEGADTIVTSPEGGWSIVNVRALMSDAPAQPKLNARVGKEIWRAFAFAAGAGFAATRPCVLQQTTSLEQIDAITMPVPSPEQHNKLIDCAKGRGIAPIRLGTYRSACQQGWAPAPTNDVQRAIWNEIQAEKERGPSNPLKIVPPNAKK